MKRYEENKTKGKKIIVEKTEPEESSKIRRKIKENIEGK